MARYRKIDIRIWGDAKFGRLSPLVPSGQALWFYLLTGRETGIIPGVLVAGRAALAESLRWPLEGFDKGFREVLQEGLAQADFDAPLIWIPNAVRYNPPANPNVVKSWRDAWDEVPECELKVTIWQSLKGFTEGLGEGFAKGFREAIAKPSLNPSPNQEQDQEQEQDLLAGEAPAPQRANGSATARGKAKPRKRRSPKQQERDALFDVLVELFYPDGLPVPEESRVGKGVSSLRSFSPTPSPDEVRRRFVEAESRWGKGEFHIEGLIKHWSQLAARAAPGRNGRLRGAGSGSSDCEPDWTKLPQGARA